MLKSLKSCVWKSPLHTNYNHISQDFIELILSHSSDDGIVVGYQAAAQAEHNPSNTIYDAKRFIGKKLRKHELHREAARYPFKVQSGLV